MKRRLPRYKETQNPKLKLWGHEQALYGRSGRNRNETAAAVLLTATEMIGWYYGATYQGHVLKKKGNDWLLIIRARSKDVNWVAFFSAQTPASAIIDFGDAVVNDYVNWKRDKFSN